MIFPNLCVDSGTISIMRLIEFDDNISNEKFGKSIKSGLGSVLYLKAGLYKYIIKNTRNGTIQGNIELKNSGIYYIGDPCYIISDDYRDEFINMYIYDEQNTTTEKMRENREKYDTYIIDEMGGDGCYKLCLVKKS